MVPALISDSGDGSTIPFVADAPPMGYVTYVTAALILELEAPVQRETRIFRSQ